MVPRWRRAAPWLAPLALVAVACVQLALVRSAGLTPWKGGGFGMFSTTDHGGFRQLRLLAVGRDGERRVRLPSELAGAAIRARDLPTRRALDSVARAALRVAPEAFAGAHAVRVEVWRTHFDPETLAPRPRRFRAREVPLAGAGL